LHAKRSSFICHVLELKAQGTIQHIIESGIMHAPSESRQVSYPRELIDIDVVEHHNEGNLHAEDVKANARSHAKSIYDLSVQCNSKHLTDPEGNHSKHT
jgi:hypothetical protein